MFDHQGVLIVQRRAFSLSLLSLAFLIVLSRPGIAGDVVSATAKTATGAIRLEFLPGVASCPLRPVLLGKQRLETWNDGNGLLWRVEDLENDWLNRTWFFDIDDSVWHDRLCHARIEMEYVASSPVIRFLWYHMKLHETLGLFDAGPLPHDMLEYGFPVRSIQKIEKQPGIYHPGFTIRRAGFGNGCGYEGVDFRFERRSLGYIGVRRLVLYIEPVSPESLPPRISVGTLIERLFKRILGRSPSPYEKNRLVEEIYAGRVSLRNVVIHLMRREEFQRTVVHPAGGLEALEEVYERLTGSSMPAEEAIPLLRLETLETLDDAQREVVWRHYPRILEYMAELGSDALKLRLFQPTTAPKGAGR